MNGISGRSLAVSGVEMGPRGPSPGFRGDSLCFKFMSAMLTYFRSIGTKRRLAANHRLRPLPGPIPQRGIPRHHNETCDATQKACPWPSFEGPAALRQSKAKKRPVQEEEPWRLNPSINVKA